MVEEVRRWAKENSTLVYFLIAQLLAGGAAAASLLAYAVKLENRVHILETRGAAYSVQRMDAMAHQIAVLEQQIRHNEDSIKRIITEYLKDKNK